MKIVHILGSGLVGGIETHVFTLSLTQKEAGHDVSVIISQQRGPVNDLMEQHGLKVYYIDGKSGHDILAAFRLRKLLKKLKPDIIHTHGISLLSWISRGGLKSKRLNTIHVIGKTKKSRISRKLSSWINRRLIRFVNALIAVSEDVKNIYLESNCFADCSWQVIYNGIDQAVFFPVDSLDLPAVESDQAIELLMVCRMESNKHPDDAIRAVKLLREEYDLNVKLTFCGDGTFLPHCKQLAEELDVSDHITFAGRRNDVNEFMRKSHGMLFLSEYETFGLAALEALTSGCPVFCYKVSGGLHEWLKPQGCGGIISEQRSPESLAAAAASVLKDKNCWQKLRHEAIACADLFSSSQMSNKTLAYYETLLSQN